MRSIVATVVVMIGLVVTVSPAFSSGFALIEQSTSGLGNAYAGGAAAADDASVIYFNPAAMMLLKGQQVSVAAHYIAPQASFSKETGRNAVGAPLSGGESGDAAVAKALPNFYYSNRLNDSLSVGLGLNVPFGLATEYEPTWVGRYHAVKSDVMTININPAVAYKINDKVSVGAGVSAQYMEAELTSMVDFGLVAFSRFGGPAGAISNPRADLYGKLKGDSWGFGYNLGVLYTPTESTRFGVAYRSQVKHKLKGTATFTAQDSAYLSSISMLSIANAAFANQGINANIDLPASLSLSAYHRINPAWAVMADIGWTQWSSFEKLVINFEGSMAASPSVTTENWRDTWRFSTGVTYNPSSALTLRTGVAYDQAPVPDNEHRTPRIPDNDRYWLAAGAGYKLSEMLSIDCGYAHLFVKEARMNKSTATPEDQSRGTLVGKNSNSVDILSAQLNVKF